MTITAWALAVAGIAFAWLVLLAAGMKTAPRLRGGDAAFALVLPGLALCIGATSLWRAEAPDRPWWSSGIPLALALLTVLMVAHAFVFQPSPPRGVIRWRLRLGLAASRWRPRIARWQSGDLRVEARQGAFIDTGDVERCIDLPCASAEGTRRLLTCTARDGARHRCVLAARPGFDVLHEVSGAIVGDRFVTGIVDQLVCLQLPTLELLWHVEVPFSGPYHVHAHEPGRVEARRDDRSLLVTAAHGRPVD